MYRAFVQFIIQTNKSTTRTHTHTHTHKNTHTHTHIYIYIYKQYFVNRKFSYMFRFVCIIFREYSASTCRSRILPEDDADASKHAVVFTIYKILLTYIYIYIWCSFVGLDNIERDLRSFVLLSSLWWQFLTDALVQSLGLIFQGQEIQKDFLTIEVETNKLSRNVGKEFPPYAA